MKTTKKDTSVPRLDAGLDYLCNDSLVVDPSFASEENQRHLLSISPETPVFVPRQLKDGSTFGSTAVTLGKCFLSEEAARTHWWFRRLAWSPKKAEIEQMTMSMFVKTTQRDGMNAFESINRYQMLALWEKTWNP